MDAVPIPASVLDSRPTTRDCVFQRAQKENQRQQVLHRIAHGATSDAAMTVVPANVSGSDSSDEDDDMADEAFLAQYRSQRIAQLQADQAARSR